MSHRPKQQQITAQIHSGPLPPAEEFDRYNEVLPGAADRILSMAEEEQKYRLKSQKNELWMLFLSQIAGQLFAFFIGLSGITGGVSLLYHGQFQPDGLAKKMCPVYA